MRFRLPFLALLIGSLLLFMQLRGGSGGESGQKTTGTPTGAEAGFVAPNSEFQSGALQRMQEPFKPTREAAAVEEPIIEEEPSEPSVDDDIEGSISSWEARQRYWELDPLQKGSCTLSLTFYDAVSRQAVSGDARLWRLGVPANEWWTEGDRSHGRLKVKDGLVTVEDLPPGRYRAYAHFAQRGADSAPEFLVEGDLTSIEIPVEMPRPRLARLHLLDIHGLPVQESSGVSYEIQDAGFVCGYEAHYRPKWLGRRMPTDSSIGMSDALGGDSPWPRAETWQTVKQLGRGIDLGELPGDPREFETHYHRNIRVAGGRPVSVWIAARQVSDYVAILPDMTEILKCIELPDGVTLSDMKEKLHLTARAVPVDFSKGESLASQWPFCQVSFGARSSGYQMAFANWRPGQESKPQIRLQPK